MNADKICRRLDALVSERLIHEPIWLDCFDHTFPIRGSGLQQTQLTAQHALDKRANLLDSTGTDAGTILASGIVAGTTPKNQQWFGQEVADASHDDKRWLDESSKLLWQNIHGSRFDAPAFECALDLVAAGWFALYVDEDPEGGFRFEQWPIAQVYCGASKPGGKIDIVYRKYEITAEQAVTDFGEDNVSDATRKLAVDKPDDKVPLVHAIHPRATYVVDAMLAKNLPFASCHVELKAKKIVRESGYHEFPVIVPRWALIPGSVYAVGCAFNALPDMRMLNTLCFDELANADLAIAGMWIAEDDGVINPRTIKVGPRKIIIANSIDSMKELKSGGDWQLADALVARKQAAIRKVFMADQLQPQDGPQMTAYEVHVRVALIRQLLGPTYGRLESEYLEPLIERCFGIAYRAGIFQPAPRSLMGRISNIKYLSPLARAQSLEEVSAMDQHETALINESVAVPEVLDTYDWDEAARTRAELLGVPSKLIRKADDVTKRRKARAEAEEEAAEAAAQQEALVKAAPGVIERAVA